MPGPADKPLCCKIVRCSGGLLKGNPQYTLMMEQEGGKTGAFLAAARKRKGGPGGASFVLSVRALQQSLGLARCIPVPPVPSCAHAARRNADASCQA